MVVEDTPSDRWFFAEIARARGHLVVACETGEDALESFDRELPDVLLLDLVLPGVQGIEVCRRLRSLPGGDRPFVMIVTGSTDPEALRDGLAAGADDFLEKPADADVLNVRLAIAERRVARQRALRRAEDELEARSRELQTLFANVHDVFFSVDVTESRLIQLSPASLSIFGHEPDSLATEDARWRAYLLPPSPSDRDPWRKLREIGPSEPLTREYPIQRADGAERWVRISLQVRPDRDRGGLRADGVVSDITDDHRARHQLAERNRELAALHRLSELGVGATTAHAAYAEMLAVVASVTGWPIAGIERIGSDRETLRLTAVHGIGLPGDEGEPEAPLRGTVADKAVGDGRPVVAVGSAVMGTYAPLPWIPPDIEAHAVFPLTAGGRAFGTMFLAHRDAVTPDLSFRRLASNLATTVASHVERLDAEEAVRESESLHRALATELKQANEELESFAYSISHDLRAPLRTMEGFAHTLLREYGARLPAEARNYAERIIASGRQSERLIGDLLAYSRLSFEKLELKPVELDAVVDAAVEQVRGDITDTRASVEVERPLPVVLGNHTTLVQILANLLANAVKFVAPGRRPQVRVRGESDERTARVWVEDNGIGIPAGQEERIFGVFERLGDGSGRPGTGIGLAIVRRGVQRVGGTCGVQPRPGGGSAFWFEVPRERRQRPRGRSRRS